MAISTLTARHPVVQRLCQAINDHDLDAIVACFAAHYRNDTPAHPARSFTGRDQVRSNWTQILAAVPDLSAELVESHADGGIVWAEWDWSGTRADGTPLQMRGVTVLGVDADTVAWARFYMEPVDADGMTVDAAVRAQVGPQ
jgi:ketosteroid isomerase-like protein